MTTLLTAESNATKTEHCAEEAIATALQLITETHTSGESLAHTAVPQHSKTTENLCVGKAQKQEKEWVFNRSEKKYLINNATAEDLIKRLGTNLIQDKRGTTTIRNLYLDTQDFRLIRRSIEKPLYKEKLRVRTYGEVVGPDHEAFVEVKKKLDGQVYKRRLALPLAQAELFSQGRIELQGQIARELAWSFKMYSPLVPAISVICERRAFTYPGLDGNVRITLDSNIRCKLANRTDFYLPAVSPSFQDLLPKDTCVMEIKVLGAIPLGLVKILSELELYPTSFSKVGKAFELLSLQG